jgi:hypothetical protein
LKNLEASGIYRAESMLDRAGQAEIAEAIGAKGFVCNAWQILSRPDAPAV